MTTRPWISFLRTTVFAGLFLTVLAAPSRAQGPRAFVLTNNSLVALDTDNPTVASATVAITQLTVGDTLVAIDFRPQNGFLYGLGYNSAAGTVQLYHISYRTGVATAVGATGAFVAGDGTTPAPITGTSFGFDFNPTVDRIRVVNDAGQNFRINPGTGVFVDGNTGVSGIQMDGAISGATSTVDATAYTNNQPNATVTTQYTLSAATNQLFIQNPPNNGTQTVPVNVMLGGSPLDFTSANGLDIPPGVNVTTANAQASGIGFAALTVGGLSSLYTIDLTTGIATNVGLIGTGAFPIQGLAVQGEAVDDGLPTIGLSADGTQLVRFNTAATGTTVTVNVTGISVGDVLVGIDWRPQTGQLSGLGVNDATNAATFYLIDPQTGAATIVGTPGQIAFVDGGSSPVDLPAASVGYGVDFNPAVDRIRIVTNTGLNFRVNPNNGAPVDGDSNTGGINTDGPINGLPAGSTGVSATSYTNSFGQLLTGGVTTLYSLDPMSNMLFVQNPPNNGTLTAGLNVTLGGGPLDFTAVNGFDIPGAIQVSVSGAAASGRAYAVLTVGPSTQLYGIELSTGATSPLGAIGAGVALAGLAVGDGPLDATATTLLSSPNPSVIGQPVTFTATVTPVNATGTVAFTIAGLPITGCSARPLATGAAMCTTSFPTTGNFQIVAIYGGDQAHYGSTSAPLTQTVNTASTTTTLTVDPNPAQEGETITFTAIVAPGGATGTVTFVVDGNVAGAVGLASGQATLDTSQLAGIHQVTASYGGDAMFAASTSAPVTLTILVPPPLTQYFAEGATGFFQTDIGILNASKTDPSSVVVSLFPDNGSPLELLFTLDPLTRRTVDVNAFVGNAQAVSALVESNRPVAATRQMTWGNPVYGSTLESGIRDTATTWYFAEGATSIFSLFYLVGNPGSVPANVTLTHLLEGGASPITQTEVVPAFTRRTFWLNTVPALTDAALSTVVTSDVPVVAERAMYLNTGERLVEGGTAGRGATALSPSWSFAEGATGFFKMYLLLGNPNVNPATVDVRYQLTDGTTITKSYPVAGRSRRTIEVNGEDPLLASTAVGTTISSSLPIVAERAMWWGTPWSEGSVALGTTETGTVWAVGEGAAGGSAAESTFVLVSNGSATVGTVRFTVVYDDGTRQEKDYTLLGNARLTVPIGEEFSLAIGQRFSVLVESLTMGVAITVESARYQSPLAFGDGGGAALATKIQ